MKHRGKQRRHYRRPKNRQQIKSIGTMFDNAIGAAVNRMNNLDGENLFKLEKNNNGENIISEVKNE